METAIVTSLIALLGSFLVAVLTYWSTKHREREAAWRKEKLAYYMAFIESLSGIVDGDASPEGHKAYAKTSNNLQLFAPQAVILALNEYRKENSISNVNRTPEEHDRLLAKLLLAIRRDIGVSPQDEPDTFSPILWASGTNRNKT
ncbi:MAG: hypothetical protein LUQ11_07095 [Methylococcaceae bacterium]|nr:hypothetical protein [Methylococcaceae bacterium]